MSNISFKKSYYSIPWIVIKIVIVPSLECSKWDQSVIRCDCLLGSPNSSGQGREVVLIEIHCLLRVWSFVFQMKIPLTRHWEYFWWSFLRRGIFLQGWLAISCSPNKHTHGKENDFLHDTAWEDQRERGRVNPVSISLSPQRRLHTRASQVLGGNHIDIAALLWKAQAQPEIRNSHKRKWKCLCGIEFCWPSA